MAMTVTTWVKAWTANQKESVVNIQSQLDQFRDDNPYDADTQAKRLLATDNQELILYVLSLGLATAKQRQRHQERAYIKNTGMVQPKERLVPRPGGATGSVIKIKPTARARNAMRELVMNVWEINGQKRLGDANKNDLAVAIKRENASSIGHSKNAEFYGLLQSSLEDGEMVRQRFDDKAISTEIEKVYGEFRKSEAA
jgi:hypothetical protein